MVYRELLVKKEMETGHLAELENRKHNLAVIDEVIGKSGPAARNLEEVREFLQSRVSLLERTN